MGQVLYKGNIFKLSGKNQCPRNLPKPLDSSPITSGPCWALRTWPPLPTQKLLAPNHALVSREAPEGKWCPTPPQNGSVRKPLEDTIATESPCEPGHNCTSQSGKAPALPRLAVVARGSVAFHRTSAFSPLSCSVARRTTVTTVFWSRSATWSPAMLGLFLHRSKWAIMM